MQKKFTAEEILAALNQYYKESIFITDGEGNIIFVNEVGAERIGPPREELMYKNVKQLVKEGVYDKSTSLTAIQTKQDAVSALTYRTKNSSISHSIPVLDARGNVEMVVTTNMSMEHNKEWEEIIAKERAAMARMQRELDHLRLKGHSRMIVGSPAMQTVMQTIQAIAPTDSNVVILGESGTGKDVMARFIHENSLRADKAFISINCAAIPESLMESELFGYEEGAFTGARKGGKIGKIQLANHGTFFLDEIGDMPLYLQAKLLRVLNDKKVERIGNSSTSLINVDVRIIAATNQNLEEMIERKEFREDLYYRLNVVPLRLPPLRERPDDIPFLIQHFIKKYNKILGKEVRSAAASVMELMMEYRWPGNVRELENCIEYMMTFEKTQVLSLDVVPQKILSLRNETVPNLTAGLDEMEDKPLKIRLQEKEQEILKSMAARYGGHPTKEQVKEICQRLDISVASYYRTISI